jgi:predicted amidohydrolase YtcJ
MYKMSLEPCPRVLLGGTLIDGTGAAPIKDSVIVIQGEWIMAVGKREETPIPAGSEVYNISGMTVTPGMIDSHCHFLSMGIAMKTRVDLSKTKSLSDAINKIKERVKDTKKGEWILGGGYDESKWPENRYINRYDLDTIAPDNPVMLTRVCGHLVSINAKAMENAGITKDTEAPEGGKVDKDEQGEPTGILRDCRQLVMHAIPEPTHDDYIDGIAVASDFVLSLGCTGVHDAGLSGHQIRAYQDAYEQGKLRVRANLMLREEAAKAAGSLGLLTGFGDEMLMLGPAKLLMDGSLGARTAALFEPYEDEPTTKGLLRMKPEALTELVIDFHDMGLQVAIHAIGDLAVEHSINSISEALRQNPRKDHRHRIEHCEIMTSNNIERIGQLGIVPDMQPNFIGEWSGPGSMYNQRLGDKRERMSNPYRWMIDEGIPVAFGSDGMPFDPIYGIWSAINHPIRHNRITLEEAVKCYTLNSAYAGFQEKITGSIEPGKLADLAVFKSDLTEIPKEEIRDAGCYMTLVNGKILYHEGDPKPSQVTQIHPVTG